MTGLFKKTYNQQLQSDVVLITAGQCYVTDDATEMIGTMLGSCISVCLRDTDVGVGGMNHFLLPDSDATSSDVQLLEMRYGVHAMEHLLNDVLKRGGQRNRIEVKVFGGGNVLPNLTTIGEHNIAFTRRFLRDEGLRVSSAHVGGTVSRRVVFHPHTGKVLVRPVQSEHNRRIAEHEDRFLADLMGNRPEVGGVELF